ncbi:MAG: hypothetical protein ACE5L7_07555 [Candidatus Aminicenantales bacterium]
MKGFLLPLVREIIQQKGLKIYFVMVSWWGRGDEARWTGAHLINTLRKFQKKGLCEILLSYQEGNREPSALCQWCRRSKTEVFYADQFMLVSRDGKEVIVPRGTPGKAENVMKAIKWIEKKTKKQGLSPKKVLIVFVDDDYTQYHWINYFLLFAPWVLSFAKKTGDEEIDRIIGKIRRVSFIKSGSPRIILPFELQGQIVRGVLKPMDYLDLTMAVIDLASLHQRLDAVREERDVDKLAAVLRKIRREGQIFAPRSRMKFLGKSLNDRLESIWREYIYRGGRVTQRLEIIFRYLSRKNRYRWMRQFTYLLHGDQGAPLDAWQEFSPSAGYALEISLLMQAICDKAFQDRHVLNIISLPHSHQRSKELAIWNMLDNILFALDLLRVLYQDLSVRDFLSLHRSDHHYPMLDRYGDVIAHRPQYRGMKIYPPLKSLTLE